MLSSMKKVSRIKKEQCGKTKGSFLLELLIAFALISVAMTVVVDSFMTSLKSYRMIYDQGKLSQAFVFVLEDMSRETRVSDTYGCAIGVLSPCVGTTFSMEHIVGLNNQTAGTVAYSLVNGEIHKDGVPMTNGAKVRVTNFSVNLLGEYGVDQVRAYITLSAQSVENPNNTINLQTSFTERLH